MISISKGMLARLALFGFDEFGFKEVMCGAVLRMYCGEVPKNADTPTDAIVAAILEPLGNGQWTGACLANGAPTFFRWEYDTKDERCMQGTVGPSDADIVLHGIQSMIIGDYITLASFSPIIKVELS